MCVVHVADHMLMPILDKFRVQIITCVKLRLLIFRLCSIIALRITFAYLFSLIHVIVDTLIYS